MLHFLIDYIPIYWHVGGRFARSDLQDSISEVAPTYKFPYRRSLRSLRSTSFHVGGRFARSDLQERNDIKGARRQKEVVWYFHTTQPLQLDVSHRCI